MRARDVFGKQVRFEVTFKEVAYVGDEPQDFSRKLFETDNFIKLIPPIGEDGKPHPQKSSRKIVFTRCVGEGLIIGQTSKHEGVYEPGGEERASLRRKKTHTFWIVATGINKTVLAEKPSSKVAK